MRSITSPIVLFFLVFTTSVFAQHTRQFKSITKNIVAVDSSSHEYFYKDGTIKEIRNSKAYEFPEYTYHKKCGEFKTFYKGGILKSKELYDNYGNVITAVFYNANGTTWYKSKTIKIDSDLTSPNTYFTSENHLTLIKEVWEYKFGPEIGKMYLKSQGTVSNGTKIGVWKTYDVHGRLEEEVDFGG